MSLTSYRAAPPRVTKIELHECSPEASFETPFQQADTDGGLLHPTSPDVRLRRQRRKKGRLITREALRTWTTSLRWEVPDM